MGNDDSFEREKWQAELALKKRELDIKDRDQTTRDEEFNLRKREMEKSAWRSPLIVAILTAAAAAAGNAVVAVVNGDLQRAAEERKHRAEIDLETLKNESTRILEMIKTGDTEKAAGNLDFLVKSGLLNDPVLTAKLTAFLDSRAPGGGPTLPVPIGRIGFEQTDSLSQALRNKLQTLLDGYFSYLDKLGFPPAKTKVTVRVEANESINAFYDVADNSIFINLPLADDPSVPLREYNHHILLVDKHAEWKGEYAAIESALADYFACSFLENPRMGEKSAKFFDQSLQYIRNLDNDKRFGDLQNAGEAEYPYVGAEVWGGAFWNLREELGPGLIDSALTSAWLKFDPSSDDAEMSRPFLQTLVNEIEEKQSNAESVETARRILVDRDFPI